MTEKSRSGRLLLVIPAVIQFSENEIRVDGDFCNNLRAYLAHFESVCVMCPPLDSNYSFPSTRTVRDIEGNSNLRLIVLPIPYREDRYIRAKGRITKVLTSELLDADYRLISPHAGFDWSTLAAEICIDLGLPYNMEADWNLPEVMRFEWRRLPWGLNKLRRLAWLLYYIPRYKRALRRSSLALLQGGDIYHDFVGIAPNAHSVLNVQVSASEHITRAALQAKLAQVGERPLRLCYTGRATDIKGPLLWLDVVTQLRDLGCKFRATWAGDGDRLGEMRRIVVNRHLADVCDLIGAVGRDESRDLIARSDIFLFCHMTKESPRCLVEALALGTPIVGFGSAYSRELVASKGGGSFVTKGDVEGLAREVRKLSERPDLLRELITKAAASGALLERESAISRRIQLMKAHLPMRSEALRAAAR